MRVAESPAFILIPDIMQLHRQILIGAALIAALGTTYAQDRTASPAVVQGVVSGVAYRNGGVGRDEAVAMTHGEAGYTLRLGFSEGRQNAYLADVKLDIFDAAGQRIFGLSEAGRLVDVRLPEGTYRVVATSGGVRRTGTVKVEGKQLSELYLHWSKDPDA